MKGKYFNRGNQYWCRKRTGDILLINLQAPNHHYDGDAHIFLQPKDFNQNYAKRISRSEWEKVRDEHIERLKSF